MPFFHFTGLNRENNTPRNTIHLISSSLLVYTYSGISRPSFWHLHRRPKSYAPLTYGENSSIVLGRWVTRRSPKPPWASQLCLHCLKTLGEPFRWETKRWLDEKGDPPSPVKFPQQKHFGSPSNTSLKYQPRRENQSMRVSCWLGSAKRSRVIFSNATRLGRRSSFPGQRFSV